MSRLTSTTVYLEDAQLRRLKDRARSERRPIASLVREALDQYLHGIEAARVNRELRAAAEARHG